MSKKIAVTLTWPIRWKRVANGEKIIEQTGPDEIEVDVRDGEMEGPSWIEALIRGRKFKSRPPQKVVGKKPPRGEQGSRVDEKLGAIRHAPRKSPS